MGTTRQRPAKNPRKRKSQAQPPEPAKGTPDDREKTGRFKPGHPGFKPKGAVEWRNRRLPAISADYLAKYGDDVVTFLLSDKRVSPAVKVRMLEMLMERAEGKAPQTVKHAGLDPDSPEAILLRMAGQPVPGFTQGEETPAVIPIAGRQNR